MNEKFILNYDILTGGHIDMRKSKPLNTALRDALETVGIGENSMPKVELIQAKAVDPTTMENVVDVVELDVKPEVLDIGKVVNITSIAQIKTQMDERSRPRRSGDTLVIDELKYFLSEELRCGISCHIPVTKDGLTKNIPVIIAKPCNSKMFHIVSAMDSSYRLGYAFLGYRDKKNPKNNKFHDVDWDNRQGKVDFVVCPKTPNKNVIINNKLGIPHGLMAEHVSAALHSWFRSEFEKFIQSPTKMRSFNAPQTMIFENITIDHTEAGIRWHKPKGSKKLFAYRKRQHGDKNSDELDPKDSFGHSFIGQDRGGVRGQWKPKSKEAGMNYRAPTVHGKGGMLTIVRNLIYQIITEQFKEVTPELL